MMVFSLDYFKRLERPLVYLADPNKNYLGTIQARELQSDICFNNISSATFKVYKYEDGIETANYESIEILRLVEITSLGWFQITKSDKYGYGTKYEYKEVEVASLENEATSKALTSFGQLGTEDDEQGGLDRYKLFSIADPDHSILHIWQKKLPSWSIGYVDPMITQEYRTFTNDEVGAYSFLVEDVSKTFECIFQFDTYNQTVNAYKIENIGQMTSIFLSYRNLVKSIKMTADFSDIKTVYTVAGGDDNGSTLGIIEVNPSGNNQITNFSYYKPWMSQELQTRLDQYQIEFYSRQDSFNNALTNLQSYYIELNDLYNKLPLDLNSPNWSDYGLEELNTKYDIYNNNMALYVGTNNASYITNYNLREAVNAQITIRQTQITAKEKQIDTQYTLCKSLILNIHDFLGDDLYKELSRYYHEDTFTDDTFVATSEMTVNEILQMKKDLLALAKSDLAKRCKPQYQIEVDAVNFIAIPEFKEYADQLELGNIITLDFGDGVLVESRLLMLHMNWDNPTDFSLTFSSKNRLDGVFEQLAEIQSQANGVSTAFNISGTGWNAAKNKTSTFNEYMSSTLNLANQKLKNSSNETFIADSTGTKWRKLINGTDNYSPNQMWGAGNGLYLTQNNWQTVSMAIGEGTYNGQSIYGIWAPLICGDLLLGQNLSIINQSGNFNINNNGFSAVYGNNTVSINPNDPNNIFSITVGGSRKLYVDVVGSRLVFNGTLDGVNGNFSGVLSAATGTFAGAVTAGQVIGSEITGSTITGSDINGSRFTSFGYRDSIPLKTIIENGYIASNYMKVKPMNGTTNDFSDDSEGYTFIGAKQIGIYHNGTFPLLMTNGDINCTSVVATTTLKADNIISNKFNGVSVLGDIITSFNKGNYSFNPVAHTHDTLYNGPYTAFFSSSGNFANRNQGDLGSPTFRWGTGYFASAPSVTSDRELKHDIEELPEIYKKLILKLKPVRFKYNDGSSDRFHTGFISQDVENDLFELGIDAKDFGGFVKQPVHEKINKYGEYDVNTSITGYLYMLRSEEFISPAISVIQQLDQRISDLELKLANG